MTEEELAQAIAHEPPRRLPPPHPLLMRQQRRQRKARVSVKRAEW